MHGLEVDGWVGGNSVAPRTHPKVRFQPGEEKRTRFGPFLNAAHSQEIIVKSFCGFSASLTRLILVFFFSTFN